MTRISFGTSGWRGIFCEDFTFENVKTVTQAIADHLRDRGQQDKGVVIGYDARFMGDFFAREAVRVLAGSGIRSFLCNRDTPTPVIAFEILRQKAAGGINFTASHNPPHYNGLKFSPSSAGPALPETTKDIENRANAMIEKPCYREIPFQQAQQEGLVEVIDPRQAYFEKIRELVDLDAIARSGLTIAVNPLYGTARGYLDALLRDAGVPVVTINDHLDPYFGGLPPEPAEENIEDFARLVRGNPDISLGLATDGDADRYGIIDGHGIFYEPNYILAMLFDYLIRVKGKNGDAARSVATSHFLDAVAAHHGVQVHETPVGFKYIGELISEDKILIGGEESAGLSVRNHVPDKDGIIACLLVAEMVAVTAKPLVDLLTDLYRRVGEFHTRRVNIRLTPELDEAFAGKMQNPPDEFAGKAITEKVTIDGVKFLLEDDCWVLFRKSGTEPVVRVYAEARTEGDLGEVLRAAEGFVNS